ncbi:MAG TPA: hypothetical protein VGO93_13130 [Candidatus Xenobia bacterium]|jgi:hypothetical protein
MNSLPSFSNNPVGTGGPPAAFGFTGATTATNFTAPAAPVNTGAEQIANLLQTNISMGMTWQQGLEDFNEGMQGSQNLNSFWGTQNTQLTSFENNCQSIENQDYNTLTTNGTAPPPLPTVPTGGTDAQGASTGLDLNAMWAQDNAALAQFQTECQQSQAAQTANDPFNNLLTEFNNGSLIGSNGFASPPTTTPPTTG